MTTTDTPATTTARAGRRGPFFAVLMLAGLAIVLAGVFPFRQLIAQERLVDNTMEQLDALATDLGTNRSELMRRGAQAVLDAERLAAADRELRAAYRRQPADPALVQSARRLAADTAPAW